MSHRPLTCRAPLTRRALPSCLLLTAALTSAGCRGAGAFKISPISDGMTPATLLGCVAEVASESGLSVIERRADAPEPTLWARSDSLATQAAAPRRIDVLTVSFKRLGRGLKVLAQTFDLRTAARADARAAMPLARAAVDAPGNAVATGGASAARMNDGPSAADAKDDDENDGTLWQATAPSLRVAEARDAVLARCGSLGP